MTAVSLDSGNLTGRWKNSTLAFLNISCKWDYKFQLGQGIASGICVLSGLFILFLGYRKRRISFFLVGFLGAGILTYLVCIDESSFSTTINLLIGVAGGLFVSLFTTTILYCGYFITGLFAGFSLGFGLLMAWTTYQYLYSVAIPCTVIAGVGLVQVFVTLWWRRVLLIVSTSILGSTMFASGVDYFVENLFLLRYTEQKIFYSRVPSMCWYSYVILGLWPGMAIIGALIQLFWTGKEKHKTNYVFIYRRRRQEGQEQVGLLPPGTGSV